MINNRIRCEVLAIGLLSACASWDGLAAADGNPFQELAALEAKSNRQDPAELRKLIEHANRLTLHGAARTYARELIKLQPDDGPARKLLRHKSFLNSKTDSLVWLDWFEAEMWERHQCVRDLRLGYCRQDDRMSMKNGRIRTRTGLVAVEDFDHEHSNWAKAHEVYSRFFHIKATLPLAAVWYVADDLDQLTFAYLDYFEIERLPSRRFTTHLYRNVTEAETAQAGYPELLTKYGAYFDPRDGILHVLFDSLDGLPAVRHEAAHALNREFVGPTPPQWFDEGVGVLCQFARPREDYTFEFGRFPKHGFGMKFVDAVRDGALERMADVHAAAPVTMSAEHYSRFRSMAAFFMEFNDKRYRMPFINALFRKQGAVSELVSRPEIDAMWLRYVEGLRPASDYLYIPPPDERAEEIKKVLKAKSSAVLYPFPDASP